VLITATSSFVLLIGGNLRRTVRFVTPKEKTRHRRSIRFD